MADTVKSSSELKMVFAFEDNDDRTVTIQNPSDDLDADDIKAVSTLAKNTNPIVGDKTGAACVGIKSAKSVQKTITHLDLTAI